MKFQWNINTAVIKCQDYAGWYASLSLCWNGEDRMAASFYKESMGIRHGESAFSEIWWNPGIFFFLLCDLQIRSRCIKCFARFDSSKQICLVFLAACKFRNTREILEELLRVLLWFFVFERENDSIILFTSYKTLFFFFE